MAFDFSEFPKVLSLYLALGQFPTLAPKIRERMRQELFQRGVITPEAFESEVRKKAIQSQKREGVIDPLTTEQPETWQRRQSIIRDDLTDFYFAYNLPHENFEVLLKEILSERIPAQDIVLTIHPELAPWEMLFAQGEAYESLPSEERNRVEHHIAEIKVVLIKAMISDHLPYLAIAREWFDISDLKKIRSHRIGRGKIGGKAAGVLLAACILRKSTDPDLRERIEQPRSWFLGSDVFYQFSQFNGFLHFANQKYKEETEIRADYPGLRETLLHGSLPDDIIDDLKSMLAEAGDSPLIVRSSSLLEDSFGTSFAGKYDSFFCSNQGSPEENLDQFLAAIKSVYASVYSPNALLYRRRAGLTEYDERMAILIQETIGRRVDRFFLPDAAGVALSHNQFRWSPRIDREAGFIRLVWGLGTRAVEQLEGNPRLIALSHPDMRPESSQKEIHRHAQSYVDLIDLDENNLKTMPVQKVIGPNTPHLRWIAQIYEQDYFRDLVGTPQGKEWDNLVITFNDLLRRTSFPSLMRRMLDTLETAYGNPVDTEFAIILEDSGNHQPIPQIYILQCRPQSHYKDRELELPHDIPQEKHLFKTTLMVPDGFVQKVRYAVYVPPQAYYMLEKPSDGLEIARLIGRIDKHLSDERFVLIGPGRWGSNNPILGIPVTYGDIYHSRALIEIALGEQSPEPSYGTHFFQDLIEANIFPLAISLSDSKAEFNQQFFDKSENILADILPEDAPWSEHVRVLDILAITGGELLELVMNGDEGEAIAYLKAYRD
jgi:hypothetical protein